MKKLATKLMLLSTAALVMLGSCEKPSDPGADSTETSESGEVKSPTKIKHKDIPYLQENIFCNLDSYVDIEYSDGSLDKTYDVKTNSKNVTIEGHRVKSSEVGVFYVTITAGGLTTKLDLTVLSNDQIKMEAFLEPLLDDPQNFTIDVHYEDDNGQDQRLWKALHNARYTVIYDPDDLYALDEDGNPDNFILAKLSDGNGYKGYITEGANHTPKPVFEPGMLRFDNYIITIPLELDPADSSYVSLDGDDVLLMSATFAESLMWSVGIPSAYNSAGGKIPFFGAVYMGYDEIGVPNGNPDVMTFDILVGDESNYGVYCTIELSNIGTSELSWMNAAVADASYVPEKIVPTEIPAAFQAINAAGNFTLTLEAWSVDVEGKITDKYVPSERDIAGDAAANFFGTCDAVITEKYTSSGIYTEFKGKKIEKSDGGLAQAADYSIFDISAVWNEGGASYSARLDQETGALPAREAISGVTDVFQMAEIKTMAANNITAAGANQTNWTSKKTEGTKVTFAGDMGDNQGTSQTNLLAFQLFGLLGGVNYGVLKDWAGTWTKAEDGWGDGEKHAYSRAADYRAFIVDTSTNEVEVDCLMYAPFNDIDNNYFMMKFTFSDIGTTSFDFSTLANANENPGILA